MARKLTLSFRVKKREECEFSISAKVDLSHRRMDMSLLLRTAAFAARAHAGQVRKDIAKTPMIEHPLDVARRISESFIGADSVPFAIQAALLHDTIEDTEVTAEQIRIEFGDEVMRIVLECSDDNTISSGRRKQAQIDTAASKSVAART